MQKNRAFFLTLAISASAIVAGLVLAGCGAVTPTPDLTPQQVVTKFYRWYIGYPGNPLVDREYRHSPYLADSFVQEIDETLANFSLGSADPILLAQDVPERFSVGDISVVADQATVIVDLYWGGNPTPSQRQIDLQLVDGKWQIVDISLIEP